MTFIVNNTWCLRVPARSLPMAVLNFINVTVGFFALEAVNIPMFLCLRRTAALFTLAAEYFILRKVASAPLIASVTTIALGALIAGSSDFTSNYGGYLFTLGNNLCTAASLAKTKSFSESTQVLGFGIVYYNALVAIPLSISAALINGEFTYALSYPALFNPVRFLLPLVDNRPV